MIEEIEKKNENVDEPVTAEQEYSKLSDKEKKSLREQALKILERPYSNASEFAMRAKAIGDAIKQLDNIYDKSNPPKLIRRLQYIAQNFDDIAVQLTSALDKDEKIHQLEIELAVAIRENALLRELISEHLKTKRKGEGWLKPILVIALGGALTVGIVKGAEIAFSFDQPTETQLEEQEEFIIQLASSEGDDYTS